MGTLQFRQIGSDGIPTGKTLMLAGWDAPKGRPRQKEVFKSRLTIRQAEVYYPNNDVPSRFIFGAKQEPIELEGRFMDSTGGKGYAKKLEIFAKNFVNDKLPCEMTWTDVDGVVASFVGLIEWIEIGPESGRHFTWKLSYLIDEDRQIQKSTSSQPEPVPFPDRMAQIQNDIAEMMSGTRTGTSVTRFPPSLDFGLSEMLDSITNAINTPFAALNDLSNQLADMSKATMAAIRRAQSGTHQLKTTILDAKLAFESISRDAAVVSSRASEDLDWIANQTSFSVNANRALKSVLELASDLARAEQGLIGGMETAINGDTWESIAVRSLKDVSRAADIQQLNGETGMPIPGTSYLIPR